jgi:hypothetical protein
MGHAPTLKGSRDAMFSCKFLLAVAFTFATFIALPSGAEAQRGGGPSSTPPYYLGPCDVIRGGCAEAYSVTRAMKASYAGPLFQLVRLSDNVTLNVGQTNHVVDTSGIPTFCDGNILSLQSNLWTDSQELHGTPRSNRSRGG